MNKIFIGYDSRMPLAFAVTIASIINHCPLDDSVASNDVVRSQNNETEFSAEIAPLVLSEFVAAGLYTRPTKTVDGNLYDEISEHQMATEFAISRFLIPKLMNYQGWAVFCDSDFLFRKDIAKLFELADRTKAIQCVHHQYEPEDGVKMQGQVQSKYNRKNWSSLMLINCAHPAHRDLDALVNTVPGRDLHGFCWLKEDDIGELPPEWNWLEGHSPMELEPAAVHFTRGTPDMPGYEAVPYADEWEAAQDFPNRYLKTHMQRFKQKMAGMA